jgi:hypothetical protein
LVQHKSSTWSLVAAAAAVVMWVVVVAVQVASALLQASQ